MMPLGLLLFFAVAPQDAAALPAPTDALCQDASEMIENRVGFLLRQPTVISAKMGKKELQTMGAIEAFKMEGRPIADAMSAKYPPRARDQQGTPDPVIDKMGFDRLFAFSKTCIAAKS